MKKLDETKAYDLRDLNDKQIKELLEWLKENDEEWKKATFLSFECLNYHDGQWWQDSINGFETTNALTLFEPDFKKGDKVLWTDDKVNWQEGVYITDYKGFIIVADEDDFLYSAIEIKPLDEIKSGDWVKCGERIMRYEDGMSDYWKKVTNKELIKLLNEEL